MVLGAIANSSSGKYKVQDKTRKSSKPRTALKRCDTNLDSDNAVYDEEKARIETMLGDTLNPSHLHVENISAYYVQRRLLGWKRFWYESIKYDKATKKWKASVYRAPLRKSLVAFVTQHGFHALNKVDDVQPSVIGHYDTEDKALRAFSHAVKVRNVTNPLSLDAVEPSNQGSVEFPTVYRICIVSDKFKRCSYEKRMQMVYEALLEGFQLTAEVQSVARCRHFDAAGKLAAKLPQFRYLDAHFIVDAKTNAQWDFATKDMTITERLGPSHMTLSTLAVDSRAATTKKSITKLLEEGVEDRDVINIDKKGSKQGSIFAHFYHGLPSHVKELLLVEQATLDSSHGAFAKNTEATIAKYFAKRRRKLRTAALMLQYVFRARAQSRVLRKLNKLHHAAGTMQRCYRGYYTRCFTQQYYTIATFAATHIQAVIRSYFSRQRTKQLRILMTQSCLKIQPVVRGYLARKYVAWIRLNHLKGLTIQRVFRGYLARKRVAVLKWLKHERTIVIPAATRIQLAWRGYYAKKLLKDLKAAHFYTTVTIPSATLIQAVVRGFLARKLAKKMIRCRSAAIKIQRRWKVRLDVQHFQRHKRILYEHKMATRISAASRGYICRQLYKRIRRRWRHVNVEVPSVIKIQSLYRGYRTRLVTYVLPYRIEAATTIQDIWRIYRKRVIAAQLANSLKSEVTFNTVSIIQRGWRCYAARKKVRFLMLARRGQMVKAAIAIQSCWMGYNQRSKIQELKKLLTVERFAKLLTSLMEENERIIYDTEDAKADIVHVKKGLKRNKKAIDAMKKEALRHERRLPEIDELLDEAEGDGTNQGESADAWKEAFIVEKRITKNVLELTREEILGLKMRELEYVRLQQSLELEVDDLGADYDEYFSAEVQTLEMIRREELQRAKDMASADRLKAIRKQKNRWKVKSIRKNVIKRNRKDLKLITQETEVAYRNESLGSISYEKFVARTEKIRKSVRDIVRSRRTDAKTKLERQGTKNKDLLHTVTAASDRALSITNEMTFAARHEKHDVRSDRSIMCWECGRVRCKC